MIEETNPQKNKTDEIITATNYCVNTKCTYVYELLHGEIIGEKKITLQA